MSLPLKHWTISVEERTEQIDADLAVRLAPFAPSKSARVRFAYDLVKKMLSTPGSLTLAIAAVQAANGMTKSYVLEFPAEVPIAGQGGSVNPRQGTDPLLLKFSRLRAASGRVLETVAWAGLLSRERTHVIGRLA